MFFYISLAVILVPFVILEVVVAPKTRSMSGFCIFFTFIYFVLIAGLRDESGYDWYVYQGIYNGITEQEGFLAAIKFGSDKGSEVGFSALLYLLGICGVSFWGVQVLICIFNFYVFVRLNSLLGMGLVSGVFIYYCWLFLVLQMAVMRMSLALSLLMLGMIALLRGRRFRFASMVLVASTFHLFSLAIGVVAVCAKARLSKTFVVCGVVLVMLLYGFGIDVFGVILQWGLKYMPSFIENKVEIYLKLSESYFRGLGEFLYKFCMVLVFFYLLLRGRWQSDLECYLIRLVFIYIVCLFLFWKYPIFHDRIKYFVIMPCFYHLLVVLRRQKLLERLAVGMGFILISLAVLVYEVSGPLFYPYTPYYNRVERWLGEQGNDGEARTMRYYNDFNSQWMEEGSE